MSIIDFPARCFLYTDKHMIKCIQKAKGKKLIWKAKSTFKKNKRGEITSPNFKIYRKLQ